MLSSVYWIHLPEHTDVFSQGYIGITTQRVKARYARHCCDARNGNKRTLGNAIRKYGGTLVVDTLLQGDIHYCRLIESKLRPSIEIGWNLGIGGQAGSLGYKHTEESKEKIREASKGRQPMLGKIHSDEARDKIRKARTGKTRGPYKTKGEQNSLEQI